MGTAEKPKFDRLALDHAIFVVADYMTEPLKRKRKGDLAHANLEIGSALRDLVTHTARRAALEAVSYTEAKAQTRKHPIPYASAVEFVALNDNPGDELSFEDARGLVSVGILSEVYGVHPKNVALALLNARQG